MISISLCMIVKNEEAVLARCLDSVADLVDEIIIVDTGSTDRTKEIGAGYTDRIYEDPGACYPGGHRPGGGEPGAFPSAEGDAAARGGDRADEVWQPTAIQHGL